MNNTNDVEDYEDNDIFNKDLKIMKRAMVAVSTIRHDHDVENYEEDDRKYFQQDLKIMKRAMVAETTRRHPTMAVPNISSLHSLVHNDK